VPAVPRIRICFAWLAALALPVVTAITLSSCRSSSISPSLAASPLPGSQLHLELIGQASLETGFRFEGVELGGLSDLAYDPARGLFLAVSDDKGEAGPVRFYALRVGLADGALGPDDVEVVGMTALRDSHGIGYPGGRVDAEGIAVGPDGSLYVSSEGSRRQRAAPFIGRFAGDGTHLANLALPEHFVPDEPGTNGVRDNLAFEGLSEVPGTTTLFAAVESALHQDGPEASLEVGTTCRILRYDLERGEVLAEYVYELDAVPDRPQPPNGRGMNGLSAVLALDSDRLLALERSYSDGVGNSVRLYDVDLAQATDVSGVPSLQGVDRTGLRLADKRLVLDLDTLGIELDNLEGLSLGPRLPDGRASLLLVSDNNFKPRVQRTQFLAFAVDGLAVSAAPGPPGSTVEARPASAAEEALPIPRLQGANHLSPRFGYGRVRVSGVVTAVGRGREARSFWMQDPRGDGDPRTSDAVLVVLREGEPRVEVGDQVEVEGRVDEVGRFPALTVTSLVEAEIRRREPGGTLPEPVLVGARGRRPPADTVDDDGLAVFDPERDAVDFFESLEGMRARVEGAVVVGPTSGYGEFVVLADGGSGAARRTRRGGVRITSENLNPQRLLISPRLLEQAPEVTVGDRIDGPLVGVVDYGHGGYRLLLSEPLPSIVTGRLAREVSRLEGTERALTVATFNVENLSAVSDEPKVAGVARVIVEHLHAPDILGLQEVQDDSGPADDGVVSAAATLERLVAAIVAAGGPRYEFLQIDPANNADGGQPGGNIRVAFLYNPARVDFVARGEAGPNVATEVRPDGGLTLNPGRVVPQHPAFAGDPEHEVEGVRKSLACELRFRGTRLVLVDNHLSSKRGDNAIFGSHQPPQWASEARRRDQALAINSFVQRLLEADPEARVVVLGDLNEHEFRAPLAALAGEQLTDLIERIEPADRYTYVFQGNSQVLDHILVSRALLDKAEVDIIHVNAELPASQQASDHDPVLARFLIE